MAKHREWNCQFDPGIAQGTRIGSYAGPVGIKGKLFYLRVEKHPGVGN